MYALCLISIQTRLKYVAKQKREFDTLSGADFEMNQKVFCRDAKSRGKPKAVFKR